MAFRHFVHILFLFFVRIDGVLALTASWSEVSCFSNLSVVLCVWASLHLFSGDAGFPFFMEKHEWRRECCPRLSKT